MLDFRIESFLTVCDYMNFTKAAEALNITQPAISGHIKYIEEYYGIKLFQYKNKKLTLTKHGEILKTSLQTMVHDEKRLKKELTSAKENKIYRIGATLSVGDYYIQDFLSEYMEKHKNISLSVTVANTESLLHKLDHGNLDIVITEGDFLKDNYESRLLKEERFAVYCGKNYDSFDICRFEDLLRHRLITREKGSGTRGVFEHYLMEKGRRIEDFKEVCEFSSMKLITKMVSDNHGISVLYSCVGTEMLAEGKLKEIEVPGFHLTHDFNVLWQKGSIYGPENELFLEELKEWGRNRV